MLKNESVNVKGLQILFKRNLLIFLMSPSLQLRPCSTSQVMLTHKTYDCGRRRILMLFRKNPCKTINLECGLRYLDSALLALHSLKEQWSVNVIVQCSTISSAYLRKTKSPIPVFNKMALLRTRLTTLWNFWIRFSENVSSLETYGPLARRTLLHQTFICGEQQNCSVSWSSTHA
jgi:hypothetical protein